MSIVNSQKNNRSRILGGLGSVLLTLIPTLYVLICCSTPQPKRTPVPEIKVSKSLPPVRTHYTLKIGETERRQYPLPNMTPVWVEWHYSDGSMVSEFKYKLWDINKDEAPDYIQSFDEKQRPVGEVFDFDFDGKPDHSKGMD